MGFPASNTSGFPGNRVEPYLAGMTTTTLAKLNSSILHGPGIKATHARSTTNVDTSRSAMLPHANCSVRPIKMFNSEHQAIALVFGKLSGRIPVSPNRAAILAGRDDEGAVKRDIPGFRVLFFSVHIPLIVCLFVLYAVFPAAAQSTSNENKSKEEAKREEPKEVKKDDVRKDTAGTPFKTGGTIHFDVDLALVNVTVTDPYNRL